MIIDRTPRERTVYGLSEEEGLDLLHDGRFIRKRIDELAYTAKLMPHQIDSNEEGSKAYLNSYHRIKRNQFWLNDADVVLRRIVRGIQKKIDETNHFIETLTWVDEVVINIQKDYLQKLKEDLTDIREMAEAFSPFILLDDLYRILDGKKPVNEIIILIGADSSA